MSVLTHPYLAALVLATGPVLLPSVRGADNKYLPNDTELVVTVNLQQILAAELVKAERGAVQSAKAMLGQLVIGHPALKYLQEAGIDLFRDLHSVTFAYPRAKELTAKLLILEGRFSPQRLNAALVGIAKTQPDTLRITVSSHASIYEVTASDGKCLYAGFANATTLIAAPARETLLDALSRSEGPKKAGLKEGFQSLQKTNNDEQSISFVATGPALSLVIGGVPVPNAETAAAALMSLEGVSGAITLTKGILFQLSIYSRDDATAQRLADAGNNALRTLRALLQQKAKEDKGILSMLDIVATLRVMSRGPTLILQGEASLDALENVMKSLPVDQ